MTKVEMYWLRRGYNDAALFARDGEQVKGLPRTWNRRCTKSKHPDWWKLLKHGYELYCSANGIYR